MRTVACEFSRAKRGWIGAGRRNPMEMAEARHEIPVISWRTDRFFEFSPWGGGFANID
jgi:hypothetical protein